MFTSALKLTIICFLLKASGGLSVKRETDPNDGATKIVSDFGYTMNKEGEYLEWGHDGDSALTIISWPHEGEASEIVLADGTCLILKLIESPNGNYHMLDVGKCNGQQFMPGYGKYQNQIRILNPGFGICKIKSEFEDSEYEYYYEECLEEKESPLCIGNDEGYVGMRACSENMYARFRDPLLPKEYNKKYTIKEIDNYFVADLIQSPKDDPAYSTHHCVRIGTTWFAFAAGRKGCFSVSRNSRCIKYKNYVDCRRSGYKNQQFMSPWPFDDFTESKNGMTCVKVDANSSSQYKGKWLPVVHDFDKKMTFCVSGANNKCQSFEKAGDCVKKVVTVGEKNVKLKECNPKDLKNKSSWCYQTRKWLLEYV